MSTGTGIAKGSTVIICLCLLTACGRERLSLTVAQAAGVGVARSDRLAPPATDMVTETSQSCYGFMLRRPKAQRAIAVQARLKHADQMAAALDSRTFTVDLVGDHANVLSLQFPVVWPAQPAYTDRVTAVIDDYFAAPDILDYVCNSGFELVRLSARGVNDRRLHPLWTARVTPEGLIRAGIETPVVGDR